MKSIRLIIAAALLFACTQFVSAQVGGQKLVCVDSEYIMANIPEYGDAQEQLNSLSKKWESEIKTMADKVSEMYKKYQAEKVLLSEDQKKAREQEILKKDDEVKKLQMQYFGADGQLFKKRTELVQPIQEKIYNAIKELAQQKNYAMVFDLASGTSLLYASDKVDISDDILDELSSVMQTVNRADRKKGK